MSWIRIAPTVDIPVREGRSVRIGTESVAIFNTGNGFLALENRCPHGGGPLADGIVGGSTVTCPLHNWRICLKSGQVERPCETESPGVRTFRTRVEDGIVMLSTDDLRAAPQAA
ncbi:MAG: nitrite reductase small subunit NirD [Bryobacteraceae bacterium]|nr:nitrite reductase small subunit NirD [Bryobacteraceae bacterium]